MHRGETGRRYLLGSENLNWRAIVDTLADAFGAEAPSYTVPSPLLKTAAFASEAVATLTRTRPVLPWATAQSAVRTYRYDNARARSELGCSFRPFADTARRIARALAGD
jgi:dihydroflavonol-4-reductase